MYAGVATSHHANSYTEAVALWEKIKPIRGRAEETRPLDRTRKGNLTIRKSGTDVVIRLYRTDIVTYHQNGDVTFEPYASVTTGIAVSTFGPSGCYANYTNRLGCMLGLEHPSWAMEMEDGGYSRQKRFYLIGQSLTLHADGTVSGSVPISLTRTDRKASKRVMAELGFDQFALWYKTCFKLGVDLQPKHRWVRNMEGSRSEIRTLLQLGAEGGTGAYRELIDTYFQSSETVTGQIAKMRRMFIKEAGATKTEVLPYVVGWKGLKAAESADRAY